MPQSIQQTTKTTPYTPSEPPGPGPRQGSRVTPSANPLTPTTTLPPSTLRKDSLLMYESLIQSTYPSTENSHEGDGESSDIPHGHGHRVSDSPASSAMAVYGSVPPTMKQYQGVFGVRQEVGRTKWQEAAMDGKIAEAREEHLVSPAGAVLPKEDEELGDDGEKEVRNGRVIAVDFDGVCCETFDAIHKEHNAIWGTDMKAGDLQSTHFHQHPGWGSIAEVGRKREQIGQVLHKSDPVPGFVTGLRKLHALGHPVHIVTARAEATKPRVYAWLAKHGITVGVGDDDGVAAVWFTHAFEKMDQPMIDWQQDAGEDLNSKLQERYKQSIGKGDGGRRKLQVLRAINASLFIGDHYDNLEPIVTSHPQIPCLLFGNFGWNRYTSAMGEMSPVELMSYAERIKEGLDLPMKEIELVDGLERLEDWAKVIRWVKAWDRAAEEDVEV